MTKNNEAVEYREMAIFLCTQMNQAEMGLLIGASRKYPWALIDGIIKNPSSKFAKKIEILYEDFKKKGFKRTKSYARLTTIRAEMKAKMDKYKEMRRNGKTDT